ncbi:hypothetical protein OUZ56_016545 [Daphnia magna]|uniref:Uncharacterized protein n=1 Tax=Daphnia magna TaxID=35525 RepID=A0ABR0AQY4_9CRUS|nr:hypothetical protein OUZ56_016545 [Daphnia magna]
MPIRTLLLTSSDSTQIPSASAKPGRCPPSGRGVTGAKGRNGSKILGSSAERPIVHPLSGTENNASSQQAKNMFTVAYCYQSTYYALKPNSNPPEYYFITRGTLPPQYAQTIGLTEAPRMAKF